MASEIQKIFNAVLEGNREAVQAEMNAAITAGYAKQIHADGYAPDASQAVRVAKSLLGL